MGRHRKPSSSSISIAKVAVTGAAIGSGAFGLAAQAQAATDSEWDTVARCESSGNWAINTGNGFQGGLQFSPSTWSGYGGGQFASAANYASREQQIAIAEKVLAGQGKGAWPVCGRGLSGPTPRNLTSAPKETAATADAPKATALDNPAPQELPKDAPEAPALDSVVPLDAVVPAPEEITVGGDADPAQTQSAPAQAPEPQIIAIDVVTPQEDETIVEASLIAPAPQSPDLSDPAVPVLPTPAPAAPATAATPGASTAAVSTTTTPATAGTTTVAAGQVGVPHLPSPTNLPPGTTDEQDPSTSPNVSYLKDLWHAVQNQQIGKQDLLIALAQRSFTAPVPADAPVTAPVAAAPGAAPADTAPIVVPAPASVDVAPGG